VQRSRTSFLRHPHFDAVGPQAFPCFRRPAFLALTSSTAKSDRTGLYWCSSGRSC
jgi:hypothetical protein